jgi:predicted RNA-binding Zn-ribbon protein involved in translation (DUF1610 family)
MAKNEQQVCTFCGKPIPEKPSGDFRVPVCGSEECQDKYHMELRQVYALIAGIGGRTLI